MRVQDLVEKSNDLLHLVLSDPVFDPHTQLKLHLRFVALDLLVIHDLFVENLQSSNDEANVCLLLFNIVGALG